MPPSGDPARLPGWALSALSRNRTVFAKIGSHYAWSPASCKDAALARKARAGSHWRCTHFDIASSFSLMRFHRHGIGFPRLCTPSEVRPFAFTWKIGFFSLRAIRNSVLTPGAL